MTPAGLPPDPLLSAWHRRFPDRSHLWVGTVRLWRSELPVRQVESDSRLDPWIARASALGAGGAADVAQRLGVPEAAVAAAGRPGRQTFVFLDLPGGPVPVPVPPKSLPTWPEPVFLDAVPPAVMRPPGVEVLPLSSDWRTVPVVWAERVNAVAVGRADGIEVYATGPDWALSGSPTWRLAAGAVPAAAADEWSAAWREWGHQCGVTGVSVVRVEGGVARVGGGAEVPADTWLLAGEGPLREAALVYG